MKKLSENFIKNREVIKKIKEEFHKVIIGQDEIFEGMFIGLVCGGHILLEGVPGLAKTLAVKTFSSIMSLDFKRIQFTPDLLPADILGTEIFHMQKSKFMIKKGPLFSHIILADEINRAPSKVQSALLEAMQEKQITIGDKTFILEEPYMVMATQNPLEQEGTYPLPEAQIDRFIIKVKVNYPSKEEEIKIVDQITQKSNDEVKKVIKAEDIKRLKLQLSQVYLDQKVLSYIVEIIQATRNLADYDLDENLVSCGVSPRGSICLTQAAKAFALLNGQEYVTPDDVQAVAFLVLRHRVAVSYEAEATGITPENLIEELFRKIKTP